jgi:hypothetical protein
MNWQYEPTLKELFAEEIIQDVMRADHVNPVWLEAFMRNALLEAERRYSIDNNHIKSPAPLGGVLSFCIYLNDD